jgi:hypothetical protein
MYDLRRESPRIGVEAMCWELVDRNEVSGLAVDLSSMGLRIERPYVGGPTRVQVPLQIEVPGIDEVMWARGDAVFDTVVAGGPTGLLRRTGYHLKLAASRDMRLLSEFVYESHRASCAITDDMLVLGYYSRHGRACEPASV